MLDNCLILSSSNLNAGIHDIWRYAVINMSNHEDTHRVGFMMNQLVLNFKTESIPKIYGIDAPMPTNIPVYCGGPVSTDKITIIHSKDYKTPNTSPVNDISSVTFDDQIFKDISEKKGPKQWKIMLGFCAWLPGQLESEFKRKGSWLQADLDKFIWGRYKKKAKMWTRIVEKNSQQQASHFLESILK